MRFICPLTVIGVGRWHTVFSPVSDITTNSAPQAWASFPITNLFIFPIRHWERGTFSSPLISTISSIFKTFFECFFFSFYMMLSQFIQVYLWKSSPLIIRQLWNIFITFIKILHNALWGYSITFLCDILIIHQMVRCKCII